MAASSSITITTTTCTTEEAAERKASDERGATRETHRARQTCRRFLEISPDGPMALALSRTMLRIKSAHTWRDLSWSRARLPSRSAACGVLAATGAGERHCVFLELLEPPAAAQLMPFDLGPRSRLRNARDVLRLHASRAGRRLHARTAAASFSRQVSACQAPMQPRSSSSSSSSSFLVVNLFF